MNIEAMTKWIEALEDPANEKRQIRNRFRDGLGGVCAQGLGAEAVGECYNFQFMRALGGQHLCVVRTDQGPSHVAALNDAGWSFWDIAQALRATHLKENT